MGSSLIKGKFFIIISVFFAIFFGGFFVNSENQHQHQQQQLLDVIDSVPLSQIDKLEQLVRNLSVLIDRLDSKFDESSKKSHCSATVKEKGGRSEDDEEGFKGDNKGKENRLSKKKAGFVTKYSPFWSEKFQFISAVSLDSIATSVNVLPFRDYEGINKYVAVGDDRGRVYVFLRNGDVLVEFYTLCESPITAMLSYMSTFMNESVLVTGHRNGVILVHRVWETSMAEELSSSLHMEKLAPLDSREIVPTGSPVSILEVHQVGRSKYILSVDEDGKIKVLRENGTLYGLAVPTSRPLVFLKQRLLFLMERGAGSLDLRTMKIRETGCEGLNDSVVKNYVFDSTERSKAYGFTSSGDLIHVLLLGDVMNFKCRVRSRNKVDMDEPLAFQAIKGYLLIIGQEKIYVYNVSTQHYIRSGAPRFTFSAGIEDIKSSFLPSQMEDENKREDANHAIPLIASDREKLVVLGLGGGYIGMYRSKLPILKGESNTMWVTSPVLFFILFLFGAWQFFAKKKEALTSWGPDDPFNSTSSTSGDRSFTDSSSRNGDMMELRNNGLRGPPRRYTSPSRYPVGGGSSFFNKPNSVDTSSRPSSVDPNYRVTSDLKFRASNLESSGLRREMFVNSQVADDGN
ncbi:putative membrane protein At1g75140 [Silene latifolia]|uniref:putative membrane protein At1g75140 n=1 Tax=Silene latifolia TaxID=37657 RepID=UPI003D778195